MSIGFSEAEVSRVRPEWGDEEQLALTRVLRSGRWSRVLDASPDDSEAGQAERELAHYLGTRHFLTVASGTTALELALLASGVALDDEVVVPACTFVAVPPSTSAAGASQHQLRGLESDHDSNRPGCS